MFILFYLAGALVVHILTYTIYQVLFSPLRSVQSPFFARWTRLWELFEVFQGKFERTNLELHQRFGKLPLSLYCHI
jgi:hypothetical protein